MMKILLLCGAVALPLTIAAPAAAHSGEAVAFAVDDYDGNGMCAGGALLNPVKVAQAFKDKFDHWIYWDEWGTSLIHTNAGVDGSDFVDPTDNLSTTGVDHADVGLFVGHGSAVCSGGAYGASLYMGDASGSCNVALQNMRLGGTGTSGDLEIFIAFACQSIMKCVWGSDTYSNMDAASGTFRMLLGYHGITTLDFWSVGDMDWFVGGLYSDGVGDNWINEWYINNSAVDTDRCPVGVVWGSTSATRQDYWNDGGWNDRRTHASSNNSTYFFVDGCDPLSGQVL